MKRPPKQRTQRFADLVLDNGELVRITYADDDTDEFFESIENAMKCGGWWAPGRFGDCTATYCGMNLDRVAMRRVVGML